MSKPDNSLIAEFNADCSEAAFAALVWRHVDMVFGTAMRQIGDAGAAEEITQNVFVALARTSGKLGSHPTIAGWLHQTAINKSREWLRQELRRRKREQISLHLEAVRAGGDSVWSPLVPLLDEALLELREPDRQAVILHYIEGRTFQEIGSVFGVGEDAARKRIHRCLDQLTQFFRRRGFATPALSAGAPLFALSAHTARPGLALTSTAAGMAAKSGPMSILAFKKALDVTAWTRAQIALAAGVAMLLAVGTATVTLTQINRDNADNSWRIPRPNPDRAPLMVKILPTKFPETVYALNVGSRGDNWVGVGESAQQICRVAYEWRPGRIIFTGGEPPGRYDFISTLATNSATALQAQLKKRLGLVGHPELRNTDALVLKLVRSNAPSLKPPIPGGHADYIREGHYHCDNSPISSDAGWYPGITRFLEDKFGVPVIDETSLKQNVFIDLTWDENPDTDPGHSALKQAMLDQLGLELVPTNLPVEMLVVDKEQ